MLMQVHAAKVWMYGSINLSQVVRRYKLSLPATITGICFFMVVGANYLGYEEVG